MLLTRIGKSKSPISSAGEVYSHIVGVVMDALPRSTKAIDIRSIDALLCLAEILLL